MCMQLYEYNEAVMILFQVHNYSLMFHFCASSFFFQAIWNWVENSPDEFARLQRQPSPELSGIHFMLLTDWACQTGTFLVYMLKNIDRI